MRPFGDVRARLPEQLAAVGVHGHHELDVAVVLDEPDRVLGLGLGQLGRALERVADAARRRAVVAVEARPDAVVAVEVHAPRVAAVRIGVARPGSGWSCSGAARRSCRSSSSRRPGCSTGTRKMSVLSTMSLVAGVGRGSCATSRSAVSSVIVIGTHSRAWSDAWISTPGLEPSRCLPMRSARIVYGPRGTSPAGAPGALLVEEVGQRDRVRSSPRRCRCPRWCGTGARGRSGPASRPRSRPRPAPRCSRARRSRSWPAGRGRPCR